MTDLRTRKRIAAMRRAQDAALDLFEQDGFDAVSVEAIAARAEVSPATVYRHFGTKEGIVLWDEYDPTLFALFAQALAKGRPPFDAMRQALSDGLADIYDEDQGRILRRTRLVFAEPSILSTLRGQLAQMRAGVAAVMRQVGVDAPDPDVFAAAVVGGLEVALDRWQAERGATPLATHIGQALDALAHLDDPAGLGSGG